MSTKSSTEIEDVRNKLLNLLKEKNEKEGVEHDALILMSSFLSEIERVQKEKDINRKGLAAMIKTSGSYLTQVFRGNKPLNFYTIAKIQRVLNIKFTVQAQNKNLETFHLRGSTSKIIISKCYANSLCFQIDQNEEIYMRPSRGNVLSELITENSYCFRNSND